MQPQPVLNLLGPGGSLVVSQQEPPEDGSTRITPSGDRRVTPSGDVRIIGTGG